MYNNYETVEHMKIVHTIDIPDYHLMSFAQKMKYWNERNLHIQQVRADFFFSMIKKQNWR